MAEQQEQQAGAGALEEQTGIPAIRDQLVLIQDVAGDEWWQDVSVPMLEHVRKRLRTLVKLIEKTKKKIVYTDFEDERGQETLVNLPEVSPGMDYERFRSKAQQFVRAHDTHLSIRKLRRNVPLTATDLEELERILLEAGIGSHAQIERAKQESNGLGVFIRSLVGLDREAAKQAFSRFIVGRAPTANQIEFINLIVNYLTEHGIMDPRALYESPFTDISPRGPEGVFPSQQVDELVTILNQIRETAAA